MGTFILTRMKDGVILEERRFPNHFVDAGKQFMLDFAFNSANWLTGGIWSGSRYLGIGLSTNTNAGVIGPTTGASVPVGGTWDGVASADYKLSDEIEGTNRAGLECIRAGNTCHMHATLTNVNCGTEDLDIMEIGIFLTGNYPTLGNPTDTPAVVADRNGAMLIRGIPFRTQGTGYFAAPIHKIAGEDIIAQYVFSDFEG